MKVCIESQTLNHHKRSGLMTYTEGLVNGMFCNDKDNDYKLVYYSLTRKSEQMPGPDGGNFAKAVVKVPDRPFWGRRYVLDDVMLPAYLKKAKVNVFHRPSGYTLPTIKGIFTVLTIHDLRTLTMGDEKWKQNINDYKKTISAVDLIVVVSQCTKDDLIEHFGIDENKVKVVYLAADERYKPVDSSTVEAAREKFGLNEPYLLSVGSVPRKNIEGIIRSYAKTKAKKDFTLVLNCRYNRDEYNALIDNLGISGRVKFLDNVSDEDIVSLYTGTHSFVFPSLYEGFGLPILEAMHCGAPVITSTISACPEVAANAAALVNPENVEQISEAIDQVCHNETFRQDLIAKGFERAKMFSWDKFAQEMKKVYEMGR